MVKYLSNKDMKNLFTRMKNAKEQNLIIEEFKNLKFDLETAVDIGNQLLKERRTAIQIYQKKGEIDICQTYTPIPQLDFNS